jgi:hypothetical protein
MSIDASFEQRVKECAVLFRLGRDIEAGLRMAALFDDLAQILGKCSPSVAARSPGVFGELFLAQQRQDWLGLADTLEVELLQLFKRPED